MSVTAKQIDKLVSSNEHVALLNDSGAFDLVRFTARDRAYGEFVIIKTGQECKVHRDDITIVKEVTL